MTENEFARFLSVADVAEILGVEVSEVRRLVDSGELPAIRVGEGGPMRVSTLEVEAFISHRYEVEQKVLRMRQAEYANVTDFRDGRLL